jgi:hypothetical protein
MCKGFLLSIEIYLFRGFRGVSFALKFSGSIVSDNRDDPFWGSDKRGEIPLRTLKVGWPHVSGKAYRGMVCNFLLLDVVYSRLVHRGRCWISLELSRDSDWIRSFTRIHMCVHTFSACRSMQRKWLYIRTSRTCILMCISVHMYSAYEEYATYVTTHTYFAYVCIAGVVYLRTLSLRVCLVGEFGYVLAYFERTVREYAVKSCSEFGFADISWLLSQSRVGWPEFRWTSTRRTIRDMVCDATRNLIIRSDGACLAASYSKNTVIVDDK